MFNNNLTFYFSFEIFIASNDMFISSAVNKKTILNRENIKNLVWFHTVAYQIVHPLVAGEVNNDVKSCTCCCYVRCAKILVYVRECRGLKQMQLFIKRLVVCVEKM